MRLKDSTFATLIKISPFLIACSAQLDNQRYDGHANQKFLRNVRSLEVSPQDHSPTQGPVDVQDDDLTLEVSFPDVWNNATDSPSEVRNEYPTSSPNSNLESHSDFPSLMPSDRPSVIPSSFPSLLFTEEPVNHASSDTPSMLPSIFVPRSSLVDGGTNPSPMGIPSSLPNDLPSLLQSDRPSLLPSDIPSLTPSDLPSLTPSDLPSLTPSASQSS